MLKCVEDVVSVSELIEHKVGFFLFSEQLKEKEISAANHSYMNKTEITVWQSKYEHCPIIIHMSYTCLCGVTNTLTTCAVGFNQSSWETLKCKNLCEGIKKVF